MNGQKLYAGFLACVVAMLATTAVRTWLGNLELLIDMSICWAFWFLFWATCLFKIDSFTLSSLNRIRFNVKQYNLKLLFVAVLVLSAFLFASIMVLKYWITQLGSGDFPFYIDSCIKLETSEQMFVPLLLYCLNFLIQNPIATVILSMITAYTLILLLVYKTVLSFTHDTTASTMSFVCMLSLLPLFLTPTAIKNLYGIIFFLTSILALFNYDKSHSKKDAVLLLVSILALALVHSVPIFMFITVLIAYTIMASHKYLKITVFATVLSLMAIQAFGKTYKLIALADSFMENPINHLAFKLHVWVNVYPVFLLPVLQISFVSLVFCIWQMRSNRKLEPMYLSLSLVLTMLCFLGDIEFTERLIQNSIPVFALVLGYGVHYFRKAMESESLNTVST